MLQPEGRRDATAIRNAENSQEATSSGPHPLERERERERERVHRHRLKSNHTVISAHIQNVVLEMFSLMCCFNFHEHDCRWKNQTLTYAKLWEPH